MLALLADAWQGAAAAANTLREQMVLEQVAVTAVLKAGPIASVGKNSTSQAYRGYQPGSISHVQLAEAWTKLISFYDLVKAKLLDGFIEASIAVPADYDFDAPIHDLLNSFLRVQGQADVLPDLSTLRWPARRTYFEPSTY